MNPVTDPDKPLYSIGTAARILEISVHTMRMYEQKGLLIPYKKSSAHRLYSDSDIERLRCIRTAINVEKISIEGIRRVLSLIPCWAIIGCSETDRNGCAAYIGHSVPCWAMKEKGSFCNGRDCRHCEVYQDYGNCKSIKDRLKELLI